MLTKNEFSELLSRGALLLDGATGSNLQKMGMPRGCCTEEWILNHPEAILDLQRRYAEAGSHIVYAPTFQAQPIPLANVQLDKQTETINAMLVALSKQAAPGLLVAGDLTTMATFIDSYDTALFDTRVENYRRQIAGLLEGGADLLAAETLLYPQDAEAILTAAELEGAQTVLYTFTMQPDGSLFSGMDAGKVLRELEDAGAAAVISRHTLSMAASFLFMFMLVMIGPSMNETGRKGICSSYHVFAVCATGLRISLPYAYMTFIGAPFFHDFKNFYCFSSQRHVC